MEFYNSDMLAIEDNKAQDQLKADNNFFEKVTGCRLFYSIYQLKLYFIIYS